MTREESIRGLCVIPGVGPSIAGNLWDIGVRRVSDLKGRDPQRLYEQASRRAGTVQDRCLLYVFRLAVYFADTEGKKRSPEKLKWWNWKQSGGSAAGAVGR